MADLKQFWPSSSSYYSILGLCSICANVAVLLMRNVQTTYAQLMQLVWTDICIQILFIAAATPNTIQNEIS